MSRSTRHVQTFRRWARTPYRTERERHRASLRRAARDLLRAGRYDEIVMRRLTWAAYP